MPRIGSVLSVIAFYAEFAVRGEIGLLGRGRVCDGALSLKMGFRWMVLLTSVLAVVPVVRVGAQTAVDGAIRGSVRDVTGTAISGAVVRVENSAAGFDVSARTGGSGEFTIARVPPGRYSVAIEARGFQRVLDSGVRVEVGGVAEVVERLNVAEVVTVVNVDASAAGTLEDAPSAALTGVVSDSEVEQLPVSGRRWQTFALLMPEVNLDDAGDGLLSFRGLPATQNSTSVDGASDDQSFGGVPCGAGGESGDEAEEDIAGGFDTGAGRGSTIGGGSGRHAGAAYTFSQEAVREFRVSGQNYSAVYGHAAGGVVTTVSKSGTNKLHGSGFYLNRDSALAASNPFSISSTYVDGVVTSGVVKPHDLRQQFGGSIGGAAIADKLFYFYTFDEQRRDFPAVSSPGYAGFYSLTATQSALLGTRGVGAAKVNAALNYLDSLTGLVPRRQDQTVNFVKLDWQAAASHRLSVEYNRARSDAPGGARSAGVVDRGIASLGNSYARVDSVLGRWLWVMHSNLSNEVRAHYGRDFQFETAQPSLPQEPAVGPGGYAPQVSIGPQGLIFGTPASLGRLAYPDEQRVQFSDLATWSLGRHLVQAGGDVSLIHDRINALSDVEGSFHYDSGVTKGHAGGLVDWITDYTFNVNAYPNGGCPTIHSAVHDFCFRSFAQSFGQQEVTFDTQEWAGFVQDSWRVRPGLLLNAGLRYEYQLLPLPQQPNGYLDSVFGAVGATSVFPEDRNNIGLRFGAAWEPFGAGRGVVRIGYGQYYGRLPGATIRSALVDTALASSATHVRIVPGTVTFCPQVANQGFGYACDYVADPPAAVAATTTAMVFDRRFRLPMVQQGSLSFEHGVGAGIVGTVSYLGNLDRQLPNSVDINIAASTGLKTYQLSGGTGAAGVQDGEVFAVPLYTQRLSTSYGAVTDIVSNANATYHALVVEGRRRSRGGLELRASWTWSKAIDYGQSGGAIPRTNGQFDPFSLEYDKGLSALNYPHKVVASAVWEPIFSGRWRGVVGGWAVAPVFTESSGRGYSYDIFGGSRLSGGHESINGSGGALYLPTVGRNTLRMPDRMNVDVRVGRTVRATERVKVRGLVEVYNVTNRVNLSSVTQRAFLTGPTVNGVTPLVFQDAATVAAEGLNVPAFGTPTAAATGQVRERQVQLGLRVEF